jgi:acyl carrier protein
VSPLKMDGMTVRPEIEGIFADVFKYNGQITPETSQRDVPKWDSLQHIALVTAIEQSFGISLSMDEMVEMRTVADICKILDRHGV